MTEVKWVTVNVKPKGWPRRYSRFIRNRHYHPPTKSINMNSPEQTKAVVDELYSAFLQHIEDTRND